MACHLPSMVPTYQEDSRALPEAREAELLERVREGELHCFYELVQPSERMVYLTAFSILGNEADAEEVAQEAILKALKSLHQFRGKARFRTWLIRITINEARMRRRKEGTVRFEPLEGGRE